MQELSMQELQGLQQRLLSTAPTSTPAGYGMSYSYGAPSAQAAYGMTSSAAAAAAAAAMGYGQPQDWVCANPACLTTNPATRRCCAACQCIPTSAYAAQARPGDWFCPSEACATLN
eukprot:RCo026171